VQAQALQLLHEALVCMFLVSSCVLPLIKFIKKECPKKSGYLTSTDMPINQPVGPPSVEVRQFSLRGRRVFQAFQGFQ
jgi:hypothetical protein